MDVVEVSPVYDQPGDITAQAAHRCVYEAISALAKIKSMKNASFITLKDADLRIT